VGASKAVLVEHDGDRAVLAGHAALLQAGEEAILLLAVMAAVREALEELEEGPEDARINPAGLQGVVEGDLKAIENPQDDLVFVTEVACGVHTWKRAQGWEG
jgi:hypothetical protein